MVAAACKGKRKFEIRTGYATKVFGTNIISIDIIADEGWQEMLDNARSEQFIMVDVVINGTKFKNVIHLRKLSLTQVTNSDSDRYSFRLQFTIH